MTLTMYRMEDTERVRMKLREDRRREVREKAEKEEEMEKMKEERLEKNRKWRQRKDGTEIIHYEERGDLSEREQRMLKNKVWRERREGGSLEAYSEDDEKIEMSKSQHQKLEMKIFIELMCPFCHLEFEPPTLIFQCVEGHNLCQHCKARQDMKVRVNSIKDVTSLIFCPQCCPVCQGEISGRNIAVERLAATLWSQSSFVTTPGQGQEYVSKSFIFRASQDALDDNLERYVDSGNTSENISEIDSILLATEGETLRIGEFNNE